MRDGRLEYKRSGKSRRHAATEFPPLAPICRDYSAITSVRRWDGNEKNHVAMAARALPRYRDFIGTSLRVACRTVAVRNRAITVRRLAVRP
jgi:hypothetical protein